MTAPLKSLKILDFSPLLPGPFGTMMLADLGADVLRIEAPDRPDLMRLFPPHDDNGVALGHALVNRNKRSLGLNLKATEAVEIVKDLITKQGYNIIVEQFRPGVMTKLGVGYEQLKDICPDLIYVSLTGYGQSGPYANRAGHDLNYLALAGLLSYYGRAEGTPPPPPTQIADIAGGSFHLVIGLLSAVIRRATTGEGGHVDISMFDSALIMNTTAGADALINGINAQPENQPLNGGSFYDLYRTADDQLLSVGSLEPKFWQGFCAAIERPDLVKSGQNFDPAQQARLKAELRSVMAQKTRAEWETIFTQYDVCVEPVLSLTEAMGHPHTQARNMIVDVPHGPDGTQQQVGTPIKMTDFEPVYRHSGADLGADTRQALAALGYSEAKIDAFIATNVVKDVA